MEPMRYYNPEPGFLEFVRDSAHAVGAFLIFDEVSIGWRRCYGGSHLELGVNPDLAIFAKAMGNGHPIGAVIGTKEAMEGAHTSFISSTYWTEAVGPTAALATLQKMKDVDAAGHANRIGRLVQDLWRECAEKHGLPVVVDPGIPCLAHFRFDHEKSGALRTLYTQLMLERGFLAGPAIYATYAHNEAIVECYREATDESFGEIARIIESDTIDESLKGPVAHDTFRRLL
jgi:glutamate-1-semialdehyde 2,1-aminomutase